MYHSKSSYDCYSPNQFPNKTFFPASYSKTALVLNGAFGQKLYFLHFLLQGRFGFALRTRQFSFDYAIGEQFRSPLPFENYYFYCLKNCWRFLTKIDSFCIFFCRVDSVMLLEDGFEVVSSDASDKMLKTAYKLRWDRRRETAFDNWSRFLN